jgi:Co/Zn/Cd efflux system component
VAFYIFIESLERIFEPPVVHSQQIMFVSILGFAINIIGLLFFHEHSHFMEHYEEHKENQEKKYIPEERKLSLPKPIHEAEFEQELEHDHCHKVEHECEQNHHHENYELCCKSSPKMIENNDRKLIHDHLQKDECEKEQDDDHNHHHHEKGCSHHEHHEYEHGNNHELFDEEDELDHHHHHDHGHHHHHHNENLYGTFLKKIFENFH